MRWHLVAVLIVLRCFSTDARAQALGSPQALQAAQELMSIMSGDMIGQVSRAMIGQLWPNIEAQYRGKADQATMTELRAELEKAFEKFVADAMKEAPALYAKYFSAQELRDISAFYKTPSGTKSLQLMPTVTAELTGSILMPRLQGFQRDLEATINRVFQKHGFKP